MKPKDLTFLDAVSELDWAKLAAYIDGEGCITIARMHGHGKVSRPVLYLSITITNTDPRLIKWLLDRFGGATHVTSRNRDNHGGKWSPAYTWNVAARHGAEIVRRARQHFVIKGEQADVALAFQDTIITDRRYGRSGRPAALIAHQDGLRDQLSALKGTSARNTRVSSFSPIH